MILLAHLVPSGTDPLLPLWEDPDVFRGCISDSWPEMACADNVPHVRIKFDLADTLARLINDYGPIR